MINQPIKHDPYVKHLVECKCILPQFRKMTLPPFHKFVVFSELEEETTQVKVTFVQCPNCDAVHRILEIGLSEILNKDVLITLPTIEDIKMEIPDKMIGLLERHECDLPTWQEVKYILDNNMWGRTVVLAKEHEGHVVMGKFVIILAHEVYKVEMFERNDAPV